mmetsp:Transcript_118723/g.368868  ORF Transcript_118723/g.368868 Transcript_118723/m.368868 type:complete len:234 (+) Transcript_118723:534-1235(+)
MAASGQGHCQASAVEDATSSNHHDGATSQRGRLSTASVNHLRQQDGGGAVAGVATSLSALSADDVHASCQRLVHVLDCANHVHHRNLGAVQLVDSPLWRHAHCADEQCRLLLNDDVDELRKLAASVVLVRLPGTFSDLRQEQIHPERRALVHEVILQHLDGALQGVRGEPDASDASKAACIGHCSSQLGPSSAGHAGQQHRVLDAQQLSQWSAHDGHDSRRHLNQRAPLFHVA